MTDTAPVDCADHLQAKRVELASSSVCFNRTAKRTADRSTLSKKRRSGPKLVDPLEILTLVVPAPRGNGKFACPLCGNHFGRRCELKRHIGEIHSLNGARRFACKHPACGKSFTRKDALAKHEVVKHQGKRRFLCPTCSEKFTNRYDLSRHNIRVHSNVKKRFTCQFCSAGFSQKSQLTMHKGRVHSCSAQEPQSKPRQTPMDSLAAAAVAIAAREEATGWERGLKVPGDLSGEKQVIGQADQEGSKKNEMTAEIIAAEALLKAARVLKVGDSGE